MVELYGYRDILFAGLPGMGLITPGKLTTELCDLMNSRISREE